ncbi:MAG: hypothetical protein GY915_07390 [bacterium]|nr:hypothetical protein [bacterium]
MSEVQDMSASQSAEKFTFDRSFDDLDSGPELLNQDQVDSVRLEAFEKGRAEARGEIAALLERAITQLISETSVLQNNYEELKNNFDQESISLTFSIFEKLFPAFMEKHGQNAFQTGLQEALKACDMDRDITIRISPSLEKSLKDRLEKGDSKEGKKSSLKIQADESVSESQAFFDWEGGGLFYDQVAFTQSVEKALVAGGLIKKNEKIQENHTEVPEKEVEIQEDEKGGHKDV